MPAIGSRRCWFVRRLNNPPPLSAPFSSRAIATMPAKPKKRRMRRYFTRSARHRERPRKVERVSGAERGMLIGSRTNYSGLCPPQYRCCRPTTLLPSFFCKKAIPTPYRSLVFLFACPSVAWLLCNKRFYLDVEIVAIHFLSTATTAYHATLINYISSSIPRAHQDYLFEFICSCGKALCLR